jgi:hypothetical protein
MRNDGGAIVGIVFCAARAKDLDEDQLTLRESPEMAGTKVGAWCEMAISLQGCETMGTGMSTVG